VLSKIGAGGMGEVFLAVDETLGRRVALKILPPTTSRSRLAIKRLLLEARAAAALDHPNICSVYEVGRDRRRTFIAMQYVDGETLSARIARGPLPAREAVGLAVQLADALAEAHEHGVVHRDIKPGNVMITSRGEVKLLDFGLARVETPMGETVGDDETCSQITRPGALMGTLYYMSPEQARGAALDGRTDLFSLGILIYEMVTGVRPFDHGSAADTLSAILTRTPPPLIQYASDVPAGLQSIVNRALAKDVADRYPGARELHADLKALDASVTAGAAAPETRRPRVPSIAVLPFADMSEEQDQEFFCQGIAEEVINALARVEGLRLAGRSSAVEASRKTRDPRQVGEALGVGAVLEGSVRRSGARFRITARLVGVADGLDIWSERYDHELADIFDVQDEIARSIAGALEVRLKGEAAHRLVRGGTQNVEAYQFYLRGIYHWNKRLPDSVRTAAGYFEKALEADPNYAPAYAGLAACYIAPGYYGAAPPQTVMPLGKAAALKALSLDDSLADAHASLSMITAIYHFEWEEAEERFRRAMELNPASPTAQMWYALFDLVPMARLDEALQVAQKAEELDPLNPSTSAVVGATRYYRREFAEALSELARTLTIQPRFPIAHYFKARALAGSGRFDEAAAAVRDARPLMGGGPAVLGFLVYCLARGGRRGEAEQTLDELRELSARHYTPAHTFAEAYLGVGDHDRAFEWLGRSCDERSCAAIWLATDPIYDPLRADARFPALKRRFNLG
jgi:serine/threonine-protein kinase